MPSIISISYQEILGALAVILGFFAYAPYFKDMFDGKTKPHIFSWLIRGINAIIIFLAVQRDNAGPGARPTLFAGLISLYIAWYAWTHGGDKQIKKIDIVFLILAGISIILWMVTKTPLRSLILLVGADVFAFIPTIRKSRSSPYSETISTYILNAIKYILMLIALTNHSLITMLDIGVRFGLNVFFVMFLYLRRKQVEDR